jgi:hypothetical protein
MSGETRSTTGTKGATLPISLLSRLRSTDAVVFAGIWIVYAFMIRRFWFVTDDAFITFRFARNLALGNGLRYNLGEHTPIEGYSNFLWVLICAVFEFLELEITRWPLYVSVAAGSVLLWMIYKTLRRRLGLGLPASGLAALLFASHPSVAIYTTSGLETMAFMILLFLSFERLVLRRGGIEPITAGLACLALSLIRVEGIGWVFAIVILAAGSRFFAGEKFLRPLLKCVAIVAVGYGLYLAWRYSYYGLLMSNTVHAKAGITAARLARGFDYVAVQVLTCVIHFLILPSVVFALRKDRLLLGVPVAAMTVGFYLFAILVSGDFMAMGRFLVPGWTFAVILFAWMLDDLVGLSRNWRIGALIAGGAAVIINALPAWDVHFVPDATRAKFHFRLNTKDYRSEYQQWVFQRDNALLWAAKGRALKRWVGSDASVVEGAIGAAGYYSDCFIYDPAGLVTREVASRPIGEQIFKSPGHDKHVEPEFFLLHRPEILTPIVVSGLPERELGLPEPLSRQIFIRQLAEYQSVLTGANPLLPERYYVDFKPLPDWETSGSDFYLVYWQRIPEGESAADAWGEVRKRIELYLEGNDPYRATMEEGYPRP